MFKDFDLNLEELMVEGGEDLMDDLGEWEETTHLNPNAPKGNLREELKKSRVNVIEDDNGMVREILLVRETQAGVVKKYLESINMKGFKYYEENGSFKLISTLKDNLLNDPYWVIATTGKNTIKPPKLKYNHEVIQKYLNHIIISNNWRIMDKMDKETFTVDLELGGVAYPYKIKFVSTFGDEVLRRYIHGRLDPIMEPMQVERACSTLLTLGKKNIVENVERFISMRNYPLEDVVKSIEKEKNLSYEINGMIKGLAMKQGTKWRDIIKVIMDVYGEGYLLKVLKNNIEELLNLKFKGESDSLSRKYMETYINEVDLLDLIYLKFIFSSGSLVEILRGIDEYMKTPVMKLITR